MYAATGASYEKAVDMATKDFLRAGINCIEYKNGARHTMSEYADMALRTAQKRAYLTGEGEKRQEWGVTTVIMNKRGNPCPKCIPFVGKVIIDDVWSGGKPEDGPYPLMSTAISKGLYHPRCKDSHTTYFKGINTADDTWTEEELQAVNQGNKQEAKEQYARLQAEKYGRMSKYSLDEENKRKYGVRAEELEEQAEYYISEKNGLAAKIGDDEIPQHEEPKFIGKINIDNESEIKKEIEKFEREAVSKEIETACVITKQGEVYYCYGTENRVFPDLDLNEKVRGAIISHNHPMSETGYTFSNVDLRLFMNYELKVLRGCDELYTYEFTRNANEIDETLEDWYTEENYQHCEIIEKAKERNIGYRRWKNE